MSNAVLERILKEKVVAIVRGISSERIAELARALEKGGIVCMEITFDQSGQEGMENTIASIKSLKENFGDRLCIGAGTVMSADQVRQAAQAGAEYMISPDVNREVIEETKKLGKISIPGALTPSEIAQAYRYGADVVKVFPAGVLGSAYMKAVKTPLKHIPMLAVGGISADNCAEFLKAGASGIGAGGNLVSAKLLENGQTDEITRTAAAYAAAVKI